MTTNLRDHLQSALGDIYTIERELGGGGMSRVFLAEESKLGRRVVIKVLTSELTEGLSADRFAREVRLAARLQHPNIVPLLAADERDGITYYTMPYVEGESVRARLDREGRLTTEAAVSILRDVARALEYAHARGVVHRDIKPDNLLLSGSAAAVADFGIAKAVNAARTVDEGAAGSPETLTHIGMLIGTPAYMAPEQAAGDPNVDARVDLYAWGVVAYELLAGVPPFTGRSPQQLIWSHLAEPPLSLRIRTPDVSPSLAALIMRCLEKDPARRPQSAGELLAELEGTRTLSGEQTSGPRSTSRRVIAGALVMAAVIVAILGTIIMRARAPVTGERPVLAVLPFENLGAPADAYFADGLTEEVRSRLAELSGLQVIGGASTRQYKGTTKSLRDIARELGATHLLTATVRWDRPPNGVGRVRITPELVRAADQASVWSAPVEAPLGDVFAMQAQVAGRVAGALDVTLLASEHRATTPAPKTKNLAAYDAYLRGIASVTNENRFSETAQRLSITELERAVTLDPDFAAAWARLAMAYLADWGQSVSAAERAKAQAAVDRAWALDSTLVDTRLARIQFLLLGQGNEAAAYRLARETARQAPGNVEVIHQLAITQPNYEDELITLQRAAVLDPRASDVWGDLALAFDRHSRYEEAIRAREREIALAPALDVAYAAQATSYLLWHADTAAAREVLERAGTAISWIARLPAGIAGGMIWKAVYTPEILHARDTLTLSGYLAGVGGVTPELFHLMKVRHFMMTGRVGRARAHADSIVMLAAPALQNANDVWWFYGWFSRRIGLAEAYAVLGRAADAARESDRYVDDDRRRQLAAGGTGPGCHTLHNSAFVDARSGRPDVAVARLTELLRLSRCGQLMSRALLRADPSWAALRGNSGFEKLIAPAARP